MTIGTVVSLLLRLGLGILFLYAGVVKMIDLQGFAIDIANYRMIPDSLVSLIAATVPGIEIACGATLLLPRTVRASAWLILIMLAFFTVAVAQALARGISIECGCFGSSRDPVTMLTLARDVALLTGAALLIWLTGEKRTLASR
jgi:uncharacterized membrane protein YphA (DoxX/SURF4 family)